MYAGIGISLIAVLVFGLLLTGAAVGIVLLLVSEKTRPIGLAILAVPAVLVVLGVAASLLMWARVRTHAPTEATVEVGTGSHEFAFDRSAGSPALPNSAKHGTQRPRARHHGAGDSPRGSYPTEPAPPETEHVPAAAAARERVAPPDETAPPANAEEVRPGGVLRAVWLAIGRAADEAKSRRNAEKTATVTSLSTSASPESETVEPDHPAWVAAEPHLDGSVYKMVTVVGPYTTRAECYEHLPQELRKAVDQYAVTLLGGEVRDLVDMEDGRHFPLPLGYVEDHVVQEQWVEQKEYGVGLMYNLHVQLAFDREAQDRIRQVWRRTVVEERLIALAGLVVLVLLLLSVLYAYLKSDLATGGAYRGRLRLAAAAAIVLLIGGVALVITS